MQLTKTFLSKDGTFSVHNENSFKPKENVLKKNEILSSLENATMSTLHWNSLNLQWNFELKNNRIEHCNIESKVSNKYGIVSIKKNLLQIQIKLLQVKVLYFFISEEKLVWNFLKLKCNFFKQK